MSLSIIAATGAKRDVSEINVRDEGGVSRLIAEIWVRDENNVARQVWGGAAGGGASTALSASADPQYVSGAVSRAGSPTVSTNQATVTPAGGIAPYTYAWGAQSGWSIGAVMSASTAFARAVSPGNDFMQDFICTVTDAAGKTVTATVTAEVSNYYSGGGGGQLQ